MKLSVHDASGKATGEITLELPEVSPILLREWYERARANARLGTSHTKLRNEVRGGGRKPWRQKGTGRARQGSTRAPHWRKGGVVFGPRNDRNYSQEMPQTKRRAAIQLLFGELAEENRLVVVTGYPQVGKTKEAITALKNFSVEEPAGLILIVGDVALESLRGFHNVAGLGLLSADRIDPQTLLVAKKVFVEQSVLEDLFHEEAAHASA